MSSYLRCAVAVAAVTFLEAVRNRILMVALAFAVALIGISIATAAVSIGEQVRLIVDVGLAAASGFGTVIAIALSIASFGRELSTRTAHPVLVRPLPRWAFVLGKYLGLLATMLLVVSLMVLATAAAVWVFGGSLPVSFWPSLYLVWLEMVVVVAVALLFSTFTTPVLAATYSMGLFIAGNLARDIAELAAKMADKVPVLSKTLGLFYHLLPNVEVLSLRTQAANSLPAPPAFVSWATLYAVCYGGSALLLAMILFTRRRAI